MEPDEALAVVGGYRRWNLFAFCLISFSSFLALATQGLVIVFIGPTYPYHCSVPEGADLNLSLPIDQQTGEFHQCAMYKNHHQNETTACTDGWTHHPPNGEKTIVMEWDLVCEHSILSELSQVYYQIGAMVGEMLASIMADRFGRRWVHVSCYVIIATFGSGIAFVDSYIAFALIRPVIAVAAAASVTVGLTHLFEIFDSSCRGLVGIGLEYLWTIGYMYMNLVAYYVRDWRFLQLILALSCVVGIFNIFIPESPLWLLANERKEEAEEVLQRMAKWNGVQAPGRLLQDDEQDDDEEVVGPLIDSKKTTNGKHSSKKTKSNEPPTESGGETVMDLFRWPLLRKYTIISILFWFANNIGYYFMVLNTPSLGGNLYFNFLLGGLVEIPAFTAAFILVRYGRRINTCVFHAMAAVALFIVGFIPSETASGYDLTWVIITVAMIGKFAITASFSFIILYTKEFFPTNLRGTSAGICNFLGRIGNMSAPFLSFAAKKTPWVPNVIIGSIVFVTALVTLLLPETKDWPLPQSIADVYTYTRGGHRVRTISRLKKLSVVERERTLSQLSDTEREKAMSLINNIEKGMELKPIPEET